jgi:hypothetical protein
MIYYLDTEAPADADDAYWIKAMRNRRNKLLAKSDWTQTADNPTGNAEAWATYRQALRDFPATWTPSDTADFPDPPA